MGRPRAEFPPPAKRHRDVMRCWWNGRYWHLGPAADVKKWQAAYARLTSLWAVDPTAAPLTEDDTICSALCADYLESADAPAGQRGYQVARAIKLFCEAHGPLKVDDFDAPTLRAWQSHLCRLKRGDGEPLYSVTYVRMLVSAVRQVWKWGILSKRTTVQQYQELMAVPGPRRGEARPAKRVRAVPAGVVEATIPHLSPTVGAMVRLQLLTGMRPSELFRLSPAEVHRGGTVELSDVGPVDLDRLGVWVYAPAVRKTEEPRWVVLGRQAQEVLRPFLDRPADARCFVPREAAGEVRQLRAAARKTPAWPSHLANNAKRRKAEPRRRPGAVYTASAYRQAVKRACLRAGLPVWTPYRVRHTFAGAVDATFGLDHAQASLGHQSPNVTRRYTKRNFAHACEVARRLG